MRQFFEKHPVPQDMQAAAHAFRISDKADARDIQDIHALLKAYNLSHREPSENVPFSVYLEDAEGRKSAGSTGETFGSRLLGAAEDAASGAAANTCLQAPFPSGARILQKARICGGLYPRRLSVH